MEKIYTFTIQDFSNEIKEFKDRKERVEKEENSFFKYFIIESNNILQAINSYLEHLYEQLQKLNFNIRAGFGSVEICINVNTGAYLTINNTIYNYKKPYQTFVTLDGNGDFQKLEENIDDMSKLLANWNYIKNGLEEQIHYKYELGQTDLKRREENIKYLSSLLKKFKF